MYGLVVILDGPLKLAQAIVGGAPVVVGVGKLGVEADGLVVILNGTLFLVPVVVVVAQLKYATASLGLRRIASS